MYIVSYIILFTLKTWKMLSNAISRPILRMKYFLLSISPNQYFSRMNADIRLINDTYDLCRLGPAVTFYLHNLHVLSLLPKTKWGSMGQYILITCSNIKDINLCKILIAYNSSREGGGGSHPACPCSKSTMETLNNLWNLFKLTKKILEGRTWLIFSSKR